jgi:hypothetical protein
MKAPSGIKTGNLMFLRIELQYDNKTEPKYVAAASYVGIWINDLYTLSEIRAKWGHHSDYREFKDFVQETLLEK